MSEATQLINAMGNGDPLAANALFPLIYDELRRLAAQHMAHENPDHTLQPTALVHEAYLRALSMSLKAKTSKVAAISSPPPPKQCDASSSKRLAANTPSSVAATDNANRSIPRCSSPPPTSNPSAICSPSTKLLSKLAAEDPLKAELVKLRYFAGLTLEQASHVLKISHNTADRWWAYAKAFLYHEINSTEAD